MTKYGIFKATDENIRTVTDYTWDMAYPNEDELIAIYDSKDEAINELKTNPKYAPVVVRNVAGRIDATTYYVEELNCDESNVNDYKCVNDVEINDFDIIIFSVEIEANSWNDDLFNGTFEECIEYINQHYADLNDDEVRIAKIKLDYPEGPVNDHLQIYERDEF